MKLNDLHISLTRVPGNQFSASQYKVNRKNCRSRIRTTRCLHVKVGHSLRHFKEGENNNILVKSLNGVQLQQTFYKLSRETRSRFNSWVRNTMFILTIVQAFHWYVVENCCEKDNGVHNYNLNCWIVSKGN